MGDLAEALGVQKGSLYSHIESKADLLWEVAREGAEAFHAALDSVPDEGPVVERIRAALRAHLRVVAEQLDIATVFVREWRYLEGERRERVRRRAAPLRGAVPRALPRGTRARRAAHRPRRRHRRAARALRRELGLHVAAAGRRHRRARRPLHGAAPRRHARLREPGRRAGARPRRQPVRHPRHRGAAQRRRRSARGAGRDPAHRAAGPRDGARRGEAARATRSSSSPATAASTRR